MRSPLPDSLHIFNAISGTPTAATIQGLPNSSSVVWTWPLQWPYDLSPLISHLRYTSPRRHEDVSVCFCLIKGISPTVSCGDLIKNCVLFLAIFASFINSRSKESRLDQKNGSVNDASLIQTCAPPMQALHSTCANIQTMTLTATAFTTYKYLHPLRHSLFYFVLLVQAQIFSFWMTDWSTCSAGSLSERRLTLPSRLNRHQHQTGLKLSYVRHVSMSVFVQQTNIEWAWHSCDEVSAFTSCDTLDVPWSLCRH